MTTASLSRRPSSISKRIIACLSAMTAAGTAAVIPIKSDSLLHLGNPGRPEYDVFADTGLPTHPPLLELNFEARKNGRQHTLLIRQDDVKETWKVELNGKRLGSLVAMEQSLVHALPVPAGALRDGNNQLRIVSPGKTDDILLGGITLDPRPPDEAVGECGLEVFVIDRATGTGLPCRLTITDDRGSLAPLRAEPGQRLAVRPGVVYSPDGRARLRVRPGQHTILASRGFEYGLDRKVFTVQEGRPATVHLFLRHEVDTSGWISCDPHTHTYTYSRHGDATLEERVITLAGEHIEMPIATDHNILTDYTTAARDAGVSPHFTPVIGDEVTTRQAHFNVFPIVAGSRVPDFRIADWPRLLQNIRNTPGVEVIILNHPLNVHNQFQPFAATNYNSVTGEILQTMDFGFDAMELINSSAQQSDMMAVYRGWFGMLNAGHRITGVGSSDGHDVSRYIIGQGRTYIRGADQDPGRIDVARACANLKAGRALVSMGLWVNLTVNGSHGPGDLALVPDPRYSVFVEIAGPSWVEAEEVQIFANGHSVWRQDLAPSGAAGVKTNFTLSFPKPAHDIHLVALTTGPGVTSPHWIIPRPYQPASTAWTPRVAGSTNPIWLDADGDGAFTSARAYARRLVVKHGTRPETLIPALDAYDRAIAAQAAGLCHQARGDLGDEAFEKALLQSTPEVRAGFADYSETTSVPATRRH